MLAAKPLWGEVVGLEGGCASLAYGDTLAILDEVDAVGIWRGDISQPKHFVGDKFASLNWQ